MSRQVHLTVNNIDYWIGHESAHLAPDEQIEVMESVIGRCNAIINELKKEQESTAGESHK